MRQTATFLRRSIKSTNLQQDWKKKMKQNTNIKDEIANITTGPGGIEKAVMKYYEY